MPSYTVAVKVVGAPSRVGLLLPATSLLMATLLMVMVWTSVTVPPKFVAVTVIAWIPGLSQMRASISLSPPLWVTVSCPEACQVYSKGRVVEMGLTAALKE